MASWADGDPREHLEEEQVSVLAVLLEELRVDPGGAVDDPKDHRHPQQHVSDAEELFFRGGDETPSKNVRIGKQLVGNHTCRKMGKVLQRNFTVFNSSFQKND